MNIFKDLINFSNRFKKLNKTHFVVSYIDKVKRSGKNGEEVLVCYVSRVFFKFSLLQK